MRVMLGCRACRMARAGTSLLCGALAITMLFPAVAGGCSELRKAPSANLMRYLQGNGSSLKVECVAYAISRLGKERYVPAAEVLTRYLDFKVIPQRLGNSPVPISRIPWHDEYPAMEALVEIGFPAVSALTKAIAEGFGTSVALDNAIETLLAIYKGGPNEAIKRLIEAQAAGAARADRLRQAAALSVGRCPLEFRKRCENALAESKR
jgi:hypothetical protein